MINANELRIGNWVRFEYDNWFNGTVFNLSQRGCEEMMKDNNRHIYVDPTCIKPIPLTPEILEKAGFEWIADDEYKAPNTNPVWYIISHQNNKCSLRVDSVRDFTPISYVHQLQNIYFALTGEELKINLVD